MSRRRSGKRQGEPGSAATPACPAACSVKIPYRSQQAAENAIPAVLARRTSVRLARKARPLPVAYRCEHCGHWYVGTQQAKKKGWRQRLSRERLERRAEGSDQ